MTLVEEDIDRWNEAPIYDDYKDEVEEEITAIMESP